MKLVMAIVIGLIVAFTFTAVQWMQAQRLRRSKPAARGASREFAG